MIEPGAEFCFACGANVPAFARSNISASDTPEPYQYDPAAIQRANVATLKVAAFSISKMIMIWVMLSLIMGVVSIAISPYMEETLEETYGVAFTDSQIWTEGLCLITSGLAALVSVILLRKLKAFWVCFISCIASALLSYPGMGGFAGVMTAGIGLYMSMAVMRCRPAFGDSASE